jgi:hypothetical protein
MVGKVTVGGSARLGLKFADNCGAIPVDRGDLLLDLNPLKLIDNNPIDAAVIPF